MIPQARNRLNGVQFILLLALIINLASCYLTRKSSGGGQTAPEAGRSLNAADVALPAGYTITPVASGLIFPTGVTFDAQGRPCVTEAGYSYGEVWTTPRLLRIEAGGKTTVIAQGGKNGPWTGVTFHDGNFYVAEGGELEGGRILRITPEGQITPIIENLPSHGDHHTDGPVIGPDGWLYFGQGTATNSGVVGPDNAQFGWLKRNPEFHDIPGQDITLTGENFTSENPLKPESKEKVTTGAYSPFGTPTQKGQVIRGQVPCNGAVMRIRPEGGKVELVAWGFRNPFGLAFSPEGRLFVTDNMYDDRGSRPVWGTGDILWEVKAGTWYGWPDFHAGRLMDGHYNAPGKPAPRSLIANHPNQPPQPAAVLAVHSSSNGFDFSRNPAFGYVGQAFIAQFGDQAPAVGKVLEPVGFKVVRADVATGVVEDFAMNKGKKNGPASMLNGGGLERPLAARFTPDGSALYVVDFGIMREIGKHSAPQPGTGVLWRIERSGGAAR